MDLFVELKDFLNYFLCEKGYSKNTIDAYGRQITKLIRFLISEHIDDYNKVDYHLLVKFLKNLYENGLSASSVKHCKECCKSFFRFLKKERVVLGNPFHCIDSPKIWQKLPDILSVKEMIRLIESPDLRTKKGVRDRAILELLYATGIRVSEFCDLKNKHFDFVDRVLLVNGKGSKQRLVPFSRKCEEAILRYWKKYRPNIEYDDYAFASNKKNNRLNRSYIWKLVKKYVKKCGLDHKNVHPHTFRHCFATHLLDNDACIRVIQDMMGHSDISSTERYLHLSIKEMCRKFKKYHPRYG